MNYRRKETNKYEQEINEFRKRKQNLQNYLFLKSLFDNEEVKGDNNFKQK